MQPLNRIPDEIGRTYTSASPPTTGNDSTQGYNVGDKWVVTGDDGVSSGYVYECTNNSVGAAVWFPAQRYPIPPAELPSAINATKIASGAISNTEFQYLNGVSSNIQTQITDVVTDLADHLADTTSPHLSTSIPVDPGVWGAGVKVEAALQTLLGYISAHAAGSGVHAIAGVTGLQAALDAKAPLASPTFTGPVTVEGWSQFGAAGAAGVVQDDSGNLSVRANDTLELKASAESVDLYTNDVMRLRIANDGTATLDPTFAASLAAALGAGAPTGTVAMWGTGTPPTGYLLCDGSAVSRSTYAALFALIGTTFGSGNGSTTFNLPDFRGRAPIGVGTGSGLTARALADQVGVESVTLTGAQSGLPAHTHTVPGGDTPNYGSTAGKLSGTGTGGAVTTSSAGPSDASSSHTNMQPSLAVHFIIKT